MILCFLCQNSVYSATNDETRNRYKELVGISLCPDSYLCYICIHTLNRLWFFRTECLKRSVECPNIFSAKSLKILQRNDIQTNSLCPYIDCDANNHNIICMENDTNDKHDPNNENFIEEDQYANFEEDENEDYQNEFENDTPFEMTKELDVDAHDKQLINESYILNTETQELNNTENDYSFTVEENTVNGHIIHIESNLINDSNRHDIPKEESVKKKKSKQKKTFKKTVLSVEEQRSQLESKRKEKKYVESEFKCYNCAVGFLFKDTYQAHMMRHEESNGEFVCPICSLRFASSSVLRAHKATHSHRYTCTVCEQPVRGKARRSHADRCHRGVTVSANCHLCGGVFNSSISNRDPSRLQQHLRRSHQWKASRRRHACGVCGEQCPDQAALRTHMIKHLKRRFPCDACPSTFGSPYTLSQHKKTKHTTTDDIQLFYCEMCQVSFSSKKGLQAHVRNTVKHQQTYVECEICYRVVSTRRALLRHIQSVHCLNKPARSKHVRARIAVCHHCGHAFKGKSKLTRHLKKVCEKPKIEEQYQPPPMQYQPEYQYPYYYEQSDVMMNGYAPQI